MVESYALTIPGPRVCSLSARLAGRVWGSFLELQVGNWVLQHVLPQGYPAGESTGSRPSEMPLHMLQVNRLRHNEQPKPDSFPPPRAGLKLLLLHKPAAVGTVAELAGEVVLDRPDTLLPDHRLVRHGTGPPGQLRHNPSAVSGQMTDDSWPVVAAWYCPRRSNRACCLLRPLSVLVTVDHRLPALNLPEDRRSTGPSAGLPNDSLRQVALRVGQTPDRLMLVPLPSAPGESCRPS